MKHFLNEFDVRNKRLNIQLNIELTDHQLIKTEIFGTIKNPALNNPDLFKTPYPPVPSFKFGFNNVPTQFELRLGQDET